VTCADGTGVMMASPNMVNAASDSTLTFIYTAAGVCGVDGGAVSLDVPPGWTPPSPTPGAGGYATSSLGSQSVFVSGMRITVSGVTLARGQTLTISYNHGTAPGSATTSTFGASEQSTSTGTLTPLDASPPVSVTVAPPTSGPASPRTASPSSSPTEGQSSPPTGGPTGPAGPSVEPTTSVSSAPSADTGTMTVSPDTVTASRPGTLIFTFRAPAGGLVSSGEVALEVPPGWTTPSREPGAARYTTSNPGELSVSGRRITVTGATLSPGQPLAIIYRPTAAPQAVGPSVFAASERPAAASLLAALASSPSVTVAGPPGLHIPVQLALVLLAAGCVAAVSAIRHLRHRRLQPALTPSVQAVHHAGPPGTVSVQQTGTGVTHTVGIEPHPTAIVTTIEETRP
jgi:hypothetical protein